MKNGLLAVFILALTMSFVPKAHAARYNLPTWNGFALDWCKDFQQGCGKPAADLYCQKTGTGSPGSSAFQMRPQVKTETMTIGQNSVCDPADHRCDSFSYIECVDATKSFIWPTYNNFRLDYCQNFQQNCGVPAAKEFCQKQGFANLVSFTKETKINAETMTIGTDAVCDPKYHECDSFSFITCKK